MSTIIIWIGIVGIAMIIGNSLDTIKNKLDTIIELLEQDEGTE